MRVRAAGVNRADLLQRMGAYPPPPGASEILGLEASGVIAGVGNAVAGLAEGDRVMILVEGGAYAELVAVRAAQAVRVPDNIDMVSAGGVPEVFITAHDALFTRAGLQPDETVLIHGGGGGVGTAAIQLARRHGCRVLVTAGSAAKLERCADLGADAGINYRSEDFVARTRELTDGRGADVIIDIMGAAYAERNVDAVAPDGRIVVLGMQGGTQSRDRSRRSDAPAGGARSRLRCAHARRRRRRRSSPHSRVTSCPGSPTVPSSRSSTGPCRWSARTRPIASWRRERRPGRSCSTSPARA